jgi:hypothetical protein
MITIQDTKIQKANEVDSEFFGIEFPANVFQKAEDAKKTVFRKYLRLKSDLQEGLDDIKAGRFSEYDPYKSWNAFLKRNDIDSKIKNVKF